ncbi:MAG: hypothetical protein LBC82_07095 [Oscillospiraceae bacterium]|jgi:hypothetical protein|nr:hypothetical protein [Oscillospiraceae bacterium]
MRDETLRVTVSEDEIAWGLSPVIDYSFHVIKLNETIRGEVKGEEICVLFPSNITAPDIKENVIIFLNARLVDGFVFYVPVSLEHSVFAYDRRDRLYSFSNMQELSAFDGRNKSELIEIIKSSEIFNVMFDFDS